MMNCLRSILHDTLFKNSYAIIIMSINVIFHAKTVQLNGILRVCIFSETERPGEDGASPLHYAARFRASATRQSASRQVSQLDGIDGDVSSVVTAPLTHSISSHSLVPGLNGFQVTTTALFIPYFEQ